MRYLTLTLLLALATLTTFAAIEWRRDGAAILAVTDAGAKHTIELGLRDDGVVVWREITHGQSTTNSPAEKQTIWLNSLTVTNWPTLTNFETLPTPYYRLFTNYIQAQ